MRQEIDLKPDCSSCAALCCVVFPFDKSESFASDKQAGEACTNLNTQLKCSIFSDRERFGFKGCVTYDCYGAGQRVTQEVFKGKSWKQDSELTLPMGEALSVLRRIHEQLSLLDAAKRLPLDIRERVVAQDLEQALSPDEEWTEAGLRDYPIHRITKEVAGYLRSLSRHFLTGASAHN